MSTALTRGSFRGVFDMKRERVDLPSRNGFVFVREMSAGEMLDFGTRLKSDSKTAGLWLMARCIVSESGEPIFQCEELSELGDSLTRDEFALINTKLMEINGMGDDETKKK